jgi:hypothetical protein
MFLKRSHVYEILKHHQRINQAYRRTVSLLIAMYVWIVYVTYCDMAANCVVCVNNYATILQTVEHVYNDLVLFFCSMNRIRRRWRRKHATSWHFILHLCCCFSNKAMIMASEEGILRPFPRRLLRLQVKPVRQVYGTNLKSATHKNVASYCSSDRLRGPPCLLSSGYRGPFPGDKAARMCSEPLASI